MAVISAAVKHMLAAGMPHDAIVAAVADMEASTPKDAQAERRREMDRTRKRLLRNSAESADISTPPSPDKEIPPHTPLKKLTPYPTTLLEGRERELCEALGVTDETKSPGLLSLSDPLHWLASGCDLDADILPTLRQIGARGRRVTSWAYCSRAVFEARDRRLAPPPPVEARGNGPPRQEPARHRNAGIIEALADIARKAHDERTGISPEISTGHS